MTLQVDTIGNEVAHLSVGDFEVCVSNNPHNPAKRICNIGDYPTFYGSGFDCLDAYRHAYCKLLESELPMMTRAQRSQLEMIRTIIFREDEVVNKKVDKDDILGGPFTCAITVRFNQ